MENSPPFAWQDKRILRKIRQSFDSQHTVASALAVYNALTEIASDEQAGQFVTTVYHVANRTGLSPRTAGERVRDLHRIGIIEVITPPLKAPSAYRLLPFSNHCLTLGNGCRALSNDCRAFGKREAPHLPTLEESEESKVERGSSFPETPPMSRAAYDSLAEMRGIGKDCAEWFWNTSDARNWTDATGQPIRKVAPLLQNAWKQWQAKAAQKNRTGGSGYGKPPQGAQPDHTKGF